MGEQHVIFYMLIKREFSCEQPPPKKKHQKKKHQKTKNKKNKKTTKQSENVGDSNNIQAKSLFFP